MENSEKKPNKLQIWLAKFLKNYFGIVLFVFVVSLFLVAYYFVLSPRFQKAVSTIHNNSSEQEKKYNQVIQKLIDLKSLDRSYKKIDADFVKKVNEFLPSEYIQEQLFLELEQVIIKNGYTVNSISIQKELGESSDMPSKSIGQVKVSMNVSAVDYLDFKKLLSIMESNVRLMDVKNLSFSPNEQSASFEFSTYFLKAD